MKQTNIRKLRSAAGWAIAIAIGAQISPMRLLAQTPDDGGTLDTMIVTGSSIPTAEEEGPSPVSVLDNAVIQRAGTQDVLEVLRKSNPNFVGSGNLGSSNANTASNSTYGGSTIAIRDLPTLVLIDGRRIAPSSAAAAGGSSFSDVNLIPASLVERIEVLKDGASALYGSEAVGGVVNIILKKNFEGFESGYRYGFADQESKFNDPIAEQRVYGIFGTTTERSRIVLGMQYSENDPIYTRDRSIGVPFYGTTSYGGVVQDRNTGDYYRRNAAGAYVPTAFTDILNGFDLSQNTTATLEQRRFNIIANAEYDILDKGAMTAFTNVIYTQNYSRSQLNAQPLNTASGIVIPESTGTIPIGLPAYTGGDIDGDSDVSVRNRFVTSPRVFEQDTDFYRVVAGLKGSLAGGKFTYEAAANLSNDKINFKNSGLIIQSGLNAAIASGQLNFFTPGDQLTAADLAGATGTDFQDLTSSQQIYDLRLYGTPVDLPAGPLGLAAGFEYREENLKASPGPNIFLDSTPIDSIDVNRDITSAYGEVSVPLIGGPTALPGIYLLEADMQFRFESYSDSGKSGVPKFSLKYYPIKDLLVRASYSKSFIAPTLYELFGPTSVGFTAPGLSLNGQVQDQAHSSSGSNINLDPINSENYNLGFVYSPSYLKGFRLGADFFSVQQDGLIGTVDASTVFQSVDSLGTNSPYYNLVHQGSFTGPLVTGPNQLAGNLADTYVVLAQTNLGGQRIEGIDADMSYRFELSGKSALEIGGSGIYFTRYDYRTLPTDSFSNVVGTQGFSSNIPEWKINAYVSYEWGGLTADLLFNYQPETDNVTGVATVDIPSYREGDPTAIANYGPQQTVEEYYTFDGSLSYEFGKNKTAGTTTTPGGYGKDGKEIAGTTTAIKASLLDGLKIRAGVNNIFDREVPLVINGDDNTDLAAFDVTGRFYYVEVSKKF